MQQFGAILAFYRPYFIWSFLVNIGITIFNPHIVPAVITKLFLTVFLWYLVTETNARRKLIFYKNLGISSFKLFSSLFIIDISIMIVYIILIKEFI
ncbi:hypothetical protein [Meridianimaribacter flavus]|uniref:Uncharacterized protein n=1 Tax=Meridianimaribacter flavus TaxID=571115 RepID=A0ABY2G373_9FLAO|nr:hypothetical protein [Meridianimaribacter flavus]TBV26207.1 hypothetical protein DMZ43_09925 [Meridianimaribacter sp. CL38]TDY07632.1 hypothetical protein A8975_2694 [Meridianimaribacter flavus]